MIDTVLIGGQPADPCLVLADVTVIHGRGQFGDGATASSATIRLDIPAALPLPARMSGVTLELSGPDGPMFAGRIVESSLGHSTDADGVAWGTLTLTAAGPVAALGVRQVGDTPWPAEPSAVRAGRVLAGSGLQRGFQIQQGDTDLGVLARDVDAQPALGLLDELSDWTSAAVFDTPGGQVVYQSLAARKRIKPYAWADFPAADTWAGLGPTLTWDGAPPSIGRWPSPRSQFPVVLPCEAVQWEPEWSLSESDVINHVRVSYGTAAADGGDQPVVELTDAASVAAHNRRYAYVGTQLATSADAQARAAQLLTTRAPERWRIGEVLVDLGQFDPATRAAVLGLLCGDSVTLAGLPQPAPAVDWTGIVEGWTFTQTGQAGLITEQLVLALSDPLLSLIVMTWQEYSAAFHWSDHDPSWTWDDLDGVAA